MSELLVEFHASTREQVLAAANALLMIPALSERSLVAADIGYSSGARLISTKLRFDRERFTERARARVTFWCARAGGALRPAGGRPRPSTEIVLSEVEPSRFTAAVDRICAVTGHEIAVSPPLSPFLIVDVGGPATAGIAYDAARRRLFIPCPLAPPVGDSFVLEVALPPPGRQRVRAFVRVDEVRTRAAASPGRLAGFALALMHNETSIHAALLTTLLPNVPGGDQRAAPRLRTAAPVRVGRAPAGATLAASRPRAVAAHLRDISHRGAFIRTTEALPVGSQALISMRLPDGGDLEATASVAHVAPDGIGVQFQLDPRGESRLAEALTPVAGRSQRVLIVDDDALARRILADAFELRGFAVLTAPNAELGLHVLAEEILSLDALVTDVRMPGVDGEEFVRRIRGAGGEHDLPIVVATATLDDALARHLKAAGANRAVAKSAGSDLIVDATLAELASRRPYASAPMTDPRHRGAPPGRAAGDDERRGREVVS